MRKTAILVVTDVVRMPSGALKAALRTTRGKTQGTLWVEFEKGETPKFGQEIQLFLIPTNTGVAEREMDAIGMPELRRVAGLDKERQ